MLTQEDIDSAYQAGAAAAEALREPPDKANPWAWAQRQRQALADWRRFVEWKLHTGPLGMAAICRERARHVSVVPYSEVIEPAGALVPARKITVFRVVGCTVKDRCDCHAQFDEMLRQQARIETDIEAREIGMRMFRDDIGDTLPKDVRDAIVALGYTEEVTGWFLRRLLAE